MDEKRKEFLDILDHYQGIIYKVCWVYFPNPEDRKDNFQEIVYQLWKSFPSLKDKKRIASWIYSVAIHISISKIRIDCKMRFSREMPEISNELEAITIENEDFNVLMRAIQQLNELNKTILLLYLEDCSYKDMAEIMGISISNVGIRINRAKKELRTILNSIGYEK